MRKLRITLLMYCLFSLFCLSIAGTIQAGEQINKLAVYLPRDINTITIIRFQDSSSTQTSPSGKWERVLREHFGEERAGFLGWGKTLLVGSLFHPSVPEEAWAAGVMQLPKQTPLELVANQLGATSDTLAGKNILISPRGNILVEFPAEVMGIYRPGRRQDAARWIESTKKQSGIVIKPYLREALKQPGDIVLSFNMENLLSPQFVKTKIETDERFTKHQKLIDRIVPLLTGLRGITLSATTTQEKTACQITLDFSRDIGPSAAVVKTLFLSILEDTGAMIDEFPAAKISTTGKSVKLQCQLSEGSLHRLLSLVASPCVSTDHHSHLAANPKEAKEDHLKKIKPTERQRATKRYHEAISKKIANLKRANQNAKNYKYSVAWHENFAKSIENLSTKNVDRSFLVFGQRTAKRFRALAASLRGQEVRVNLQEKTLTYRTYYNPGSASINWWGGYGYRPPSVRVESNLQQVREKIVREELQGFEERQKIWELILDDQQEMNQRLASIK